MMKIETFEILQGDDGQRLCYSNILLLGMTV